MAISPTPILPSPHHLTSSATVAAITTAPNANALPPHSAPTSSALLSANLAASTNYRGHSPSLIAQHQQSHPVHHQHLATGSTSVNPSQVQQLGLGVANSLQAVGGSTARGPFASALRNLAKQADIKDEEEVAAVGIRERGAVERTVSAPPVGVAGNRPITPSNINSTRSALTPNDRLCASTTIPSTVSGGNAIDDRPPQAVKKRSASTPPPPEKVARLNATPNSAATIQSDLLARSGFQPYRSEERLLHSTGPFPLESYSPFSTLSAMPPGPFLNAAGLPYNEQIYLDRFQLLRAASAHPSHPHALYSTMASPYTSHLYSMLPGATLGLTPGLHERLKLEEEHRARLIREEERERELQREKDREVREQREREHREKEQKDRQQREKEQKEKEIRDKELREKEREARERERQQLLSASHHYSNQLYNPLNRNLLGSMLPHLNMGLRPPSSAIHGLSSISPYHLSNQRQNTHGAMGLNLGLPGISGVPPLSHLPPNMSHHLQQASLGLALPGAAVAAAGLSHPGFSAATLGLAAHHNLNLNHPHLGAHHQAITSAHQLSSLQSSTLNTPTMTTALPLTASINLSNSGSGGGASVTSIAGPLVPSVAAGNSITSSGISASLPIHVPSALGNPLYYAQHSSNLAALHAAAAANTMSSTANSLNLVNNLTNPVNSGFPAAVSTSSLKTPASVPASFSSSVAGAHNVIVNNNNSSSSSNNNNNNNNSNSNITNNNSNINHNHNNSSSGNTNDSLKTNYNSSTSIGNHNPFVSNNSIANSTANSRAMYNYPYSMRQHMVNMPPSTIPVSVDTEKSLNALNTTNTLETNSAFNLTGSNLNSNSGMIATSGGGQHHIPNVSSGASTNVSGKDRINGLMDKNIVHSNNKDVVDRTLSSDKMLPADVSIATTPHQASNNSSRSPENFGQLNQSSCLNEGGQQISKKGGGSSVGSTSNPEMGRGLGKEVTSNTSLFEPNTDKSSMKENSANCSPEKSGIQNSCNQSKDTFYSCPPKPITPLSEVIHPDGQASNSSGYQTVPPSRTESITNTFSSEKEVNGVPMAPKSPPMETASPKPQAVAVAVAVTTETNL